MTAVFKCQTCEHVFDEEAPEIDEPLPTTGLDFGQALAAMRDGKSVCRAEGWETGNCIRIHGNSFEAKTELYDWGECYLNETDILATDWRVVTEDEM